MILSDKIKVVAEWLSSAENELLAEADSNEGNLQTLALSFYAAANILKEAAEELVEEPVADILTPEKLEEMAAVAQAFDESGDEILQRQASVLDEVLLGISSDPNYIFNFKKAEEKKFDLLKQKYKDPKIKFDEETGVKEAVQAIEKSPVYKEYRVLQHSLQSRSCPQHPGAQTSRISEGKFQCSLDHKIYDYVNGYTMEDGSKIPATSVQEQSNRQFGTSTPHNVFDTRDQRLGLQ